MIMKIFLEKSLFLFVFTIFPESVGRRIFYRGFGVYYVRFTRRDTLVFKLRECLMSDYVDKGEIYLREMVHFV